MNKKATLDMAIVISCITGMVLSYVYLENVLQKQVSLTLLGAVGAGFLILWFADYARYRRPREHGTGKTEISQILLLGEDNNITDTWDIYRKTSIVFGRDEGENQVDINLKNTDYAGTVDGEHAVMNYSGGSWYIEDLDSENGTRIQRNGRTSPTGFLPENPVRWKREISFIWGLRRLR